MKFVLILQKLGSPTLTVTNESFVPTLTRLDECIGYLNANVSSNNSVILCMI